MIASIGARGAQYKRNTTVLGCGNLGKRVDASGFAVGAYKAEGVGMTASLGGLCPLECHCGWNWFWSLRGSYLIAANTTASATTEANAITAPGLAFASAHARNTACAQNDCEGIFIGEARLGLQYERCLCFLPATFFCRFSLEYQHSELGGQRARTGSFAFVQGGPPAFGGRADAASQAADGNLDRIGFLIGCGLRYQDTVDNP